MARNSGFRSISAGGTSEPFELQVARGQVSGHVPASANGINVAVGTAKEGIWANGGAINWPASASVMQVSSSSANDDAAGTGMRTVTVYGLNSAWELAEETVTLDGQTQVATTTSFIRVFRAKGETYGSGGTNAGVVYVHTDTATAGVPDTATEIFTTILAGEGESLQAFYSVPAGYTGYLLDWYANHFVAADEFCTFRLEYREAADSGAAGWNTLDRMDVASQFYVLYSCPVYLEEKTDVMITALSESTSRSSAGFNMVVIKDRD